MTAFGRPVPFDKIGPFIVAGLCVLYFVAPNCRLDFSAFDTRDAESYLALSRSLATGHGYSRNLSPAYYVPHTTWPPGLPLLLVPFTWLAGLPINLLLVKLGMIAYGVGGIVLAYVYAKRVTPSPLTRVLVPVFLGLNPYYWQFSRMTNSEMPTVLWALIALLLADIGWMRGTIRLATAFAFGLICGLGMLIRGSFFGALFLPLVQVLLVRSEPIQLRLVSSRYACYALGFLLPFGAWMVRNLGIDARKLGQDGMNQLAMIFRSSPVDPASPFRSVAQTIADIVGNLQGVIHQIPKSIVPALWADGSWTLFGSWSGAIAAVISVALVAISCRTVRNLPIIVMYASMAALNMLYAVGSMARLWVPVTCLLALSLPIGAETLSMPRLPRVRAALAVLTIVALTANLAWYAAAHERRPYRDANYAALAALAGEIRARGAPTGNVLSPHPQAFQLYTGLPAPMSVAGAGVTPRYDAVVAPTAEWRIQTIGGRIIAQNEVWSLVALDRPMTLAEFRERYNCAASSIASFAVISNCLIQ